MKSRSLTSSVALFGLALLLVSWALQWLHNVLLRAWPTLLGLVVGGLVITAIFAFFRHRDRW